MKVLICGSREWKDPNPIRIVVDSLEEGDTVIQGDAPGADLIAKELAENRKDLVVKSFPARWDLYGKSAGPKRNIEMLNQRPDCVYAFPSSHSVGTWHTIREADRMGIRVVTCRKVD